MTRAAPCAEPHLQRSIQEPIRTGLTWHQQWRGPDDGLIRCWERGREMRALGTRYPSVSDDRADESAIRGELPQLPWKGGIARTDKKPPTEKFGTLQYLAMWQGLRGEDLDLDLVGATEVRCARTGTVVTFRAGSIPEEEPEPVVASSVAGANHEHRAEPVASASGLLPQ